MNRYPRQLIEVDLPIKRISAHARREKSIRHAWAAKHPEKASKESFPRLMTILEVPLPAEQAKSKTDETRIALRELGLPDDAA